MRNENEMYQLILDKAHEDERIRAVMLNGSRANPNAPRDIFQDFDIVYFVTELTSFRNNPDWIDIFGRRIILQLPDDMQDPPSEQFISYAYLIQLADGNRIDLTLFPIHNLDRLEKDSQSIMLLDKDGLFAPLPPQSDHDYLPVPPTHKQYADCCNEFWWVSTYVAKGLWRDELPYARYMLDVLVREQLMKMLVWYIGIKSNYSVDPGKFGKYIKRYLEPDNWHELLVTYADASVEHTWEALFAMTRLFRRAALIVADRFGFEYPHGDDARVSTHLTHVRALPPEAREIY